MGGIIRPRQIGRDQIASGATKLARCSRILPQNDCKLAHRVAILLLMAQALSPLDIRAGQVLGGRGGLAGSLVLKDGCLPAMLTFEKASLQRVQSRWPAQAEPRAEEQKHDQQGSADYLSAPMGIG